MLNKKLARIPLLGNIIKTTAIQKKVLKYPLLLYNRNSVGQELSLDEHHYLQDALSKTSFLKPFEGMYY